MNNRLDDFLKFYEKGKLHGKIELLLDLITKAELNQDSNISLEYIRRILKEHNVLFLANKIKEEEDENK